MLQVISIKQHFSVGTISTALVPFDFVYEAEDCARYMRRFRKSDIPESALCALVGQSGTEIMPSGYRTSRRSFITRDYLERMLEDPSVKFFVQQGLQNPADLEGLIRRILQHAKVHHQEFTWQDSTISNALEEVACKKCLLEVLFDQDVGESSIVQASDPVLNGVSTYKKRPALLEPNSGVLDSFEMTYAKVAQRGRTRSLCLILGQRQIDSKPFVLTVYPGEYCPPFPKVLMSEAEKAELQAYWDRRIELILE